MFLVTCRSVKLDSATVVYVQRLSGAFYANVQETATEFRRAFGGGGGADAKISAFLTWLDEEVDRFCERIEKQVLTFTLWASDQQTETR